MGPGPKLTHRMAGTRQNVFRSVVGGPDSLRRTPSRQSMRFVLRLLSRVSLKSPCLSLHCELHLAGQGESHLLNGLRSDLLAVIPCHGAHHASPSLLAVTRSATPSFL